MEIFVFLIFGMVFVMFLVSALRSVSQWHTNNQSPRLTVEATIVAKRAHVSTHRHSHNDDFHTGRSTTYYVTFQVASGDRMELKVESSEYGLLVEGDKGLLSFQGTRYQGFQRQ